MAAIRRRFLPAYTVLVAPYRKQKASSSPRSATGSGGTALVKSNRKGLDSPELSASTMSGPRSRATSNEARFDAPNSFQKLFEVLGVFNLEEHMLV
jgi:hypothetical protein